MHRSYYALAALLAATCGSAVAVAPARPTCNAQRVAAPSRYLCTASAQNIALAAAMFGNFDDVDTCGAESEYADSCGYDPYRQEKYDAECMLTSDEATYRDESKYNEESTSHTDSWFSPPVCGGEEMTCPYLTRKDRSCEQEDLCDWDCGEAPRESLEAEDLACLRAFQQWLSEGAELAASQPDEGWKTAKIATPGWIDDYLSPKTEECENLEEQYAQAELAAAMEAERAQAESVRSDALPIGPQPETSYYEGEYESLYELDAISTDRGWYELDARTAEVDVDGRPVIWTLGRLLNKIREVFGDLTPVVDLDEVLDSADASLDSYEDIGSEILSNLQAAAAREAYDNFYADDFQDDDNTSDEMDASNGGPVCLVFLEAVAESIRSVGEALIGVANALEGAPVQD
jgi:hypothetical protein